MIISENATIVIIIALIFAYPLFQWRMNRFVAPLRDKLIKLAGEVLTESEYREIDKKFARECLRDFLNPSVMIIDVFTFISNIWKVFKYRKQIPEIKNSVPDKIKELSGLYALSTMAANPIFAILFMLEALFLFMVLFLIGYSIKATSNLIIFFINSNMDKRENIKRQHG